MPIVFQGGAPESGRSGATNSQFTFHVPNPTSPRPLPTPPPRSFGDKIDISKDEFTFHAPKIAPNGHIGAAHATPTRSVPAIVQPIAWKMPGLPPSPPPPTVPEQTADQRQAEVEAELQQQERPEVQPQQQQTRETAKNRRRHHSPCTHTKMVRVYSLTMRCDICQRHGSFGWLYRCTEDREELLRHAILTKSSAGFNFDELGRTLCTLIKPSPRSAEARADRFSFFAELDDEQMKTYNPEQIALILRQRENLRKVCREEMTRITDAAGPERLNPLWQELARTKPWVVKSITECTHKLCHYCRPNGADRVYVSLDGVANGDVPATAATGFGFHVFGKRPVCDMAVVAKVGRRRALETPASPPLGRIKANGEHHITTHTSQRATRTFSIEKLGFTQNTLERESGDAEASTNKGYLTRSHAAPNLPNLTSPPPPSNRRLIDGVVQKTSLLTLIEEPEEEGASEASAIKMEERKMSWGRFEAKPLEVEDGVAVLEESFELHLPDVISQA